MEKLDIADGEDSQAKPKMIATFLLAEVGGGVDVDPEPNPS